MFGTFIVQNSHVIELAKIASYLPIAGESTDPYSC